ncbi:HEAT repeat domain-containing protein [Cyanobacteria bacterium FACHB-63]|nr:HEAT repeat domain-containing protein [Cyanobacteria bacterium FACHB-63]
MREVVIAFTTDRALALISIGSIGSAAKVAAISIAKLLEDGSDLVRSSAADALGELGNASELVVQALLSRLSHKSDDVEVRSNVVEALGKLGNDSELVVQELLSCFTNESELVEIRLCVAEDLIKLDRFDQDGISVLETLFPYGGRDVGFHARAILQSITKGKELKEN